MGRVSNTARLAAHAPSTTLASHHSHSSRYSCFWQLNELEAARAADYLQALQFVRWRVDTPGAARALAEWLHGLLTLAPRLSPEAQLVQAQAIVFTVEQLRLPLAQPHLSERPMAITQQWYNYAFDECRAADAAAASGAAGGSLGLARRRTVFIELATACLLQTQELFFRAQAPILLEGLRSLLWAPATVEPALHCVLRLLRGAYHEPLPFWSATGMGKTDGLSRGGENPNHRDEVALLPFGSPMYHREDTRSALLRLAHLGREEAEAEGEAEGEARPAELASKMAEWKAPPQEARTGPMPTTNSSSSFLACLLVILFTLCSSSSLCYPLLLLLQPGLPSAPPYSSPPPWSPAPPPPPPP